MLNCRNIGGALISKMDVYGTMISGIKVKCAQKEMDKKLHIVILNERYPKNIARRIPIV